MKKRRSTAGRSAKDICYPEGWLLMSEREIGIGDVKDALPEDSDVEIWRDAGVIEVVLGPKASMDIETVDIGKCSDEAFDFLEKNEVKSLFYLSLRPEHYPLAEKYLKLLADRLQCPICGDTEDLMPVIEPETC
ncbi:MAG: hypothetical protein ACOX71_04255 [Lachnospiraceae bacterium]|jgi:hypothetical protein